VNDLPHQRVIEALEAVIRAASLLRHSRPLLAGNVDRAQIEDALATATAAVAELLTGTGGAPPSIESAVRSFRRLRESARARLGDTSVGRTRHQFSNTGARFESDLDALQVDVARPRACTSSTSKRRPL
jgi:hypothetical protein